MRDIASSPFETSAPTLELADRYEGQGTLAETTTTLELIRAKVAHSLNGADMDHDRGPAQ